MTADLIERETRSKVEVLPTAYQLRHTKVSDSMRVSVQAYEVLGCTVPVRGCSGDEIRS